MAKYKVGDTVKFYPSIFAEYPVSGRVIKVNKRTNSYEVAVQVVTVDEDNIFGE